MSRVTALVAKEFADLRRNPGVFVPAAITGFASLLVPFFVGLIVPVITGERLSDSSDFQVAAEMYRLEPATVRLSPEGAIQAWIFQQFLVMLILTPVAAAMSVAAFSVIGEKQARTLEPLLATPITTVELLTGKVLGAALPALALGFGVFAAYAIGVAGFAEAGVWRVLFLPRSLAVTFLLGPLASLASLQLAVCVSSRANDPRSAQQIGVLILLPIAGLLAAQLLGSLQLTLAISALIAVGLTIVNLALMVLGVRVFDRESILTRWR
jgi:ABC-2 type transport system permease protein